MSLFCNYCRIGLTHAISVREIFLSVEIGSITICHSSEMAGEILLEPKKTCTGKKTCTPVRIPM
jgi:hypothetical protein